MLSKGFAWTLLATALSIGTAEAQSTNRIGGPSNLPPAGFTGQQFVDARGCVFLRAGYGRTVNWVQRVDRNHKPLCGFPPTGSAQVAAAVEADMAPDNGSTLQATAPVVAVPVAAAPVVTAPVVTAPAAMAKPTAMAAPSPAPAPTVLAAPAVMAVAAPARGFGLGFLFGGNRAAVPVMAPAPPIAVAQTTGSGVSCTQSAPQLERVLLRNGGTALVCTRGTGTVDGWRPPIFATRGVGLALNNPPLSAQMMAGAVVLSATSVAAAARVAVVPKPPPGYKLAWKDDRLNPLRGIGTAQGQAQQDALWAATVPMVLVTDQPPRGPIARALGLRTTASSMSAPASGDGSAYVQVGSFGQPANASAAVARLSALGLPAATARITRGGKAMQIVYAGPFASTDAARSALAAAQGAGFGDAFVK